MSSPRLPLSSRPTFLPDEIARREFATVFRGYDTAEVRTFLNQLSEQQAESSDRIAEFQKALADSEERIKNPELDEEMVTSLLGEQTAQILRSAREAANEMRVKAEEEVSRQLREVHEVATRMREEAEALLVARTEEAERTAATVRAEATRDAEQIRRSAAEDVARLRAETDSELLSLRQQTRSDLVDERARSRQQARELVDLARAEARALVERTEERQSEMIEGLVRKRKIALAQVEELRAGRQRLLKAYKMVRTTLDEITDELERVEDEARQAADLAGVRSAQANEIEHAHLDTVIELARFELNDDVSTQVIDLIEAEKEADSEKSEEKGERTGSTDDTDAATTPQQQGVFDIDAGEAADVEFVESGSDVQHASGVQIETMKREEVIVEAQEVNAAAPRSSGLIIGEAFVVGDSEIDRSIKLRREAVIGKFRSQAVRRLQRAMQDEQDAITSRLRSGAGESVQALLGSVDDQAATYQRVLVKLLREVVRAGTTSVDGSIGVERGVVDRTGTVAARSLAIELVEDLRAQLEPVLAGLLERDQLPELSQLQSQLATAYRSVKGGYLDQLVDDRIGGVFDQGVAFARQ